MQRVFVADNMGDVPGRTTADNDLQLHVYPQPFSRLSRLLYFPKQRRLGQFAKRENLAQQVDVVHAHLLFSAGYLAYKLHKQQGIPYVVAVRNTDMNIFFRYMHFLHHLGRKILLNSSRIILISPAYRDQLQRYIPEHEWAVLASKMEVIPNGIDDYFLTHSAVASPSTEPDTIRLLMVGKLTRTKNVQGIVAAADRLVQQGRKVSLMFIGNLEDESLANLLQRDYITRLPHAPKEEIRAQMRQADVFVMPSFFETFGLVYAEAMSQGLPVIYSRGQGLDGYFQQGEVGLACDPNNTDELADAILRLYKEKEVLSPRCVEAARQFNWTEICQRYAAMYREIIEQNK